MDPSVADGETERLRILGEYEILDSVPEEEYQDITELAAQLCLTPISLITFVDQGRQWIKAKVGFGPSETTRDISFCHHAILSLNDFVVPDATSDPRFCDNPIVVGAPFVRFYAGIPLVSAEGYPLGTICVLDRVPRRLDHRQYKALRLLAKHVMRLLELRRIRHRGFLHLCPSSPRLLSLCREYEILLRQRGSVALYQIFLQSLLFVLGEEEGRCGFRGIMRLANDSIHPEGEELPLSRYEAMALAICLSELLEGRDEQVRVSGTRSDHQLLVEVTFQRLERELEEKFSSLASLFARTGAGTLSLVGHRVVLSIAGVLTH